MEIEKLIRLDLRDMKPYSSARDEFEGEASVFLDANENPYENGVNRYPDPLQMKLKKKIAEIKGVNTSNILLGNGSDECLDLLFRLFCLQGKDEVAIIVPSYGMYGVLAKTNGIRLNEIPLNEDFSLPLSKLLKEASGSKLLFLCSPNNPTGNSFDRETILTLLIEFKGIMVIDEAYIDFSTQQSLTAEIDKYPNLVIIQTFSKAYGMAGIRLGMLFSNPTIINWLNKIKLPYNINTLTQEWALIKLANREVFQEQLSTIKKEREKLLKALPKIPLIEKVYLSDANFILVKISNADEVYRKLISKGIVVRNRSNQPGCTSCLRISIGTPEENKFLLTQLQKL